MVKCLPVLNMKRTLSLSGMIMVWVALAWILALNLIVAFGPDKPAARASDYAFFASVTAYFLFVTYHLARHWFARGAAGGISHGGLLLTGFLACAFLATLPPYDWGTVGLAMISATTFFQWVCLRREMAASIPPQRDIPEGL
jgi:hypothetical protein